MLMAHSNLNIEIYISDMTDAMNLTVYKMYV